MCGIIGYTGHRPAVPLIVEGLRRLEYRGYDSSGVAFVQNGELHRVRAKGKLAALEEKLVDAPNTTALAGIGHTRWATHGVPAERNAHPHLSNDNRVAMIHNGIFENFEELKESLVQGGVTFSSETDTEVVTQLVAQCLGGTTNVNDALKHGVFQSQSVLERCQNENALAEQMRRPPQRGADSDKNHAFCQNDALKHGVFQSQSVLEAFACALRQVRGAYAVALISPAEPDTVYAARCSAPLILGVGTGENFVASDVPAFLPYTRDVVFLEDGEVVRITPTSWEVMRLSDLSPVTKTVQRIQWDLQSAQKDGFKHFMLKEIYEQPRVIADGLVGRVNEAGDEVILHELENLPIPKRLHIVACGTSYHSGMWARHLFESWAGIPVSLEIASEFRYRNVILDKDDLVLVISQSGETADTLAALRLVKEQGGTVLGLCNVIGSSIARDAHAVIYTQAGPEISVASTKAMCSQMVALTLMALHYAGRKKTQSAADRAVILSTLRSLPALLEAELPLMREQARALTRRYASARSFFFLGRGHAFPLALEGALKLKELSYIHAEGYAAGEMKHGPIALVDQEFPTFAIIFDDPLSEKTASNILEVQARRGPVIALTNPGVRVRTEDVWTIPPLPGYMGGFVALPALQLFSYEVADFLGKDVDQPRNLAKSVTVE